MDVWLSLDPTSIDVWSTWLVAVLL